MDCLARPEERSDPIRWSDAQKLSEIDFDRLVVFNEGPWIWQVHENQCYLGRMILRLDRPECGSLAHCSESEWRALLRNVRSFERVIGQLFAPDRYNYGQLGNIYHQMHVHAVPRYTSPRQWDGVTFVDTAWGQNWAPVPESPLGLERTYALAVWLRSEIQRL